MCHGINSLSYVDRRTLYKVWKNKIESLEQQIERNKRPSILGIDFKKDNPYLQIQLTRAKKYKKIFFVLLVKQQIIQKVEGLKWLQTKKEKYLISQTRQRT